MKVITALISAYYKDGIQEFARELIKLGCETIYGSKGTVKCLAEAGIPAIDIATVVGAPILDHRVVTLSRQVYAALLARDTPDDAAELERIGMCRIDLVCVDCYPIHEEIAKADATLESVIEQTDIGGPTLLRAAAKGRRIAIGDKNDRMKVINWLKQGENAPADYHNYLCAKAEYLVSQYALMSARYLSGGRFDGMLGEEVRMCKYGENPWQTPAGLFTCHTDNPLALDKCQMVAGTDPSFINWTDVDRLLYTMTHIVAGFEVNFGKIPKIAIGVKHGNPCGAAEDSASIHGSVSDRMMKGDELAIFGGLAMVNYAVNHDVAEELALKPLDGIVAPLFSPSAVEMLKRKKDKCRFIMNTALDTLNKDSLNKAVRFRQVIGGFLRQPNYTLVRDLNDPDLKIYGTATAQQKRDLVMAAAIGSMSNSNTITIVKNGQVLANAVGQQDRVGAGHLAIWRSDRADHNLAGAAAYSDSFFPFPDGPKVLIDAGVKAIYTSSGSVRDQETIDLCNSHGIALHMIPDTKGRGFAWH